MEEMRVRVMVWLDGAFLHFPVFILKKAFAEVVFIACQACYHLVDTSDSLTHQGGGSL